MEGRIKLHRKIDDWGWRGKPNTFSLFIYLIMNASIKDTKFLGHDIKKGDCVIGRKSLSKKLGISEDQVRTSLEHLKSTNEITIKTTNKFSIITVVNYYNYQDTSEQNPHQNPHQNPQQIPTLKEYIYIASKNDVYNILTEDEILDNKNELYIIYKMIELGYRLKALKSDIMEDIKWTKSLIKQYIPLKENGSCDYAKARELTDGRYDYRKIPPKGKKPVTNHKSALRNSFRIFTSKWKT